MMGYKHEKRLLRRLLDDFQQLVRRLRIHSFREPQQDGLVPVFYRRQGQFLQDVPGFRYGDVPCLALYPEPGIQV